MPEPDPSDPPTRHPDHVLRRFVAALDALDWAAMRSVLADDFHGHYPHDGQHFDADGLVAYNRDYPGRWHLDLVDLVVEGDRAVGRTRVFDDPEDPQNAETYWVASFATVDTTVDPDGLIRELVEVWTEKVP